MTAISLTDYRNLLYTILVAEQTASPTLLRKVHRFRPGSIGEAPVAWIGDLVTDLAPPTGGTWQREMAGEVIIAAPYPSDILEAADPFDQLQSELMVRFVDIATATTLPNTVLDILRVAEGDVELQGAEQTTHYRGSTLTTRLRIWEGRD